MLSVIYLRNPLNLLPMKSLSYKILSGCFAIAAICAMQSCNSLVEKTVIPQIHDFVYEPFRNVNVDENKFNIDPTQETALKLENGTSITIPANALVDKDNKPVKRTVRIKYREFQSSVDILLSGIPMSYDSAGVKHNFESAGMFDISASTEDNNPVFIKQGANVNVQIATSKKDNNFSFYYLDTITKKWDYITTKRPDENLDKKEKMAELASKIQLQEQEKNKLLKPKKYSKTDKIINFDVNYSSFKELAPFHSLVWRYAESNKKNDPSLNKWIYSEKWSNIKLEAIGSSMSVYRLNLMSAGRQFSMLVEPVLSGKDLEKAQNEFMEKYVSYQKIIDDYAAAQKQAMMEADLLRSFSVAKFGIYNWDRFYKDDNSIRLVANFKFDKSFPGSENAKVFLVINSKNMVIPYPSNSQTTFSFIPSDDNKLIAVLPDNRIAVFSTADFNKIDVDKYKDNPQCKITITLRVVDTQIASKSDLSKIMASI